MADGNCMVLSTQFIIMFYDKSESKVISYAAEVVVVIIEVADWPYFRNKRIENTKSNIYILKEMEKERWKSCKQMMRNDEILTLFSVVLHIYLFEEKFLCMSIGALEQWSMFT